MIISDLWTSPSPKHVVKEHVDFTSLNRLFEAPLDSLAQVTIQHQPANMPISVWFNTAEFILEHSQGVSKRSLAESAGDHNEMSAVTQWGTRNPEIGHSYIPVMVTVFGDTVRYSDIAGHWPPKISAKAYKLIDRSDQSLTFDTGDKTVTLPFNNSRVLDTVLFTSKEEYQEFVTIEVLKGRDIRNHEDDDLSEHGGGIGPRQHWQKMMHEAGDEAVIDDMDQDELEDHTGLDETTRLDERAGPVSTIRWGKPWLDAGRNGERAKPTVYNTDYTQDKIDNQKDAHTSDLETFFDYNQKEIPLKDIYKIEVSDDEEGTPAPTGDCPLVNYTTAKPTLQNVMPEDPEAPGTSGALDDDTEDTDEEMFSEHTVRSLTNQIALGVARTRPNLVLEHTDAELHAASYQVAEHHYRNPRISESDLGVMIHHTIRLLRG